MNIPREAHFCKTRRLLAALDQVPNERFCNVCWQKCVHLFAVILSSSLIQKQITNRLFQITHGCSALIEHGCRRSVIGYLAGGQKLSTVAPGSTSDISQKEVALKDGMRKLWEDHVTWTRLYIVEEVAGLPGADESAARLLKNQDDLGNAIKPYYGNDAGDQLTALLKDHITGAVEVLAAAKDDDNDALEVANIKWYANADEIATFLIEANPQNWPLADMKAGMKMHLDLTLTEAVAQLEGEYTESINDYDEVHEHILELADILSTGIINQFPDKF